MLRVRPVGSAMNGRGQLRGQALDKLEAVIELREARAAVVGPGYVDLPLAAEFANSPPLRPIEILASKGADLHITVRTQMS
jgi:hypothetical protein